MNYLGAVTVDLKKKERDYEHFTLSDKDVVKYLITSRSKIDLSYGAVVNININQAGDLFDFNQEIIALYASLDSILNRLDLKEKDQKFIHLLFEGNTVADIIKYHDYPKKTAYRTMDRIIEKITALNEQDWKETMLRNGYIKNEGDKKDGRTD